MNAFVLFLIARPKFIVGEIVLGVAIVAIVLGLIALFKK